MGVLTNLVIAIEGTLPADSTTIRKWVNANGGRYSPKVGKSVTHLIVSKDAWKKVTDPVMQAADLNIPVVSYDWLEDSLQTRRKLAVKKYAWETIKKEKKQKRAMKKLGLAADSTSKKLPQVRKPRPSKSIFFPTTISTPFESAKDDLVRRRREREAAEAANKAAKIAKKSSSSGPAQAVIEDEDGSSSGQAASKSDSTSPTSASSVRTTLSSSSSTTLVAEPEAKKLSLKDLYHYYLDSTGFEYKITLARSNCALNTITRYQLSLLESHAVPHTYCTLVQYTPAPGSITNTVSEGTPGVPGTNSKQLSVHSPQQGDGRTSNVPSAPTVAANYPPSAHVEAPRPTILPQQSPYAQHPEAQRLCSVIAPVIPSAAVPYKTLICPMNSSFADAWRAFRHAFRDITLLSWEERFESNKVVQTARAITLSIEPYLYSKPEKGLPMGLLVQESGLYQNYSGGLVVPGEKEDGYVRDQFRLPGIHEPLGVQGTIGAGIFRDKEKVRKAEEAKRRVAEEAEQKRRGELKKRSKADYNKPLFDSVTGRRRTESMSAGTASPRGSAGSGRSSWMQREAQFARSNGRWGYDV